MPTQVQFRKGTTAQHAAFTGANGEITIDTSKKTVVVHDGVNAGGRALLTENGGTVSGDFVVTGNLTVSGNTTYVNTQTLLIGDNILTLNNDLPNATAPTEDAGLEVKRGSSSNVSIIWNETLDKWTFTNDGTTYSQFATNTDIGTFAVTNKTTSYTLVLSDCGKIVDTNSNITIPNAVFSSGNVLSIYNNSAANISISNATSVTMYLGGTANANTRYIAQRGVATVLCVAPNTFIVAGIGVS